MAHQRKLARRKKSSPSRRRPKTDVAKLQHERLSAGSKKMPKEAPKMAPKMAIFQNCHLRIFPSMLSSSCCLKSMASTEN